MAKLLAAAIPIGTIIRALLILPPHLHTITTVDHPQGTAVITTAVIETGMTAITTVMIAEAEGTPRMTAGAMTALPPHLLTADKLLPRMTTIVAPTGLLLITHQCICFRLPEYDYFLY